MDSNTAIEIRLRRAHLDRHAKTLHHLRTALAEDVQAHDLLLGPRAHQLELRRLLLLLLRRVDPVVHGGELAGVDLDVVGAVLLARGRLREARRADFRVGEDDAGDLVVFEF